MTTYNPFKINSSSNNTNSFLSSQNKFSSNISNNNPFLTQNNQSFSNYSNPFLKNNSFNNNKFPSQNDTTNPFLTSNNNNNNNNIFNNNNSNFNGINNNNTNFLSNNSNNTVNPFLTNNTNTSTNNPFLQNSNQNNINNNPFTNSSNNGFMNNNQNNFASINSNPFTNILNNNNNNNNNNTLSPFSLNNGNNNSNNIFNNNSGYNSMNFNLNQNNNNTFNSNNNFGNSGNTISFGFNNNNNNNNFIFNNNPQNINNNNFFINSQQFTPILNNNNAAQNNIPFSQDNQNNKTENEKSAKSPSKKMVPLSKILSLRYQSEDFLEELLTKINEDKENAKIFSKSLNLNNYNDFIIETILSSKSKKDEYKKKKEDDTHIILKERNMEIKRRREKILNEERYQKYLKNLYKKNEKDNIKRIIKLNSFKQNANNNNNLLYNSEHKKKKIILEDINDTNINKKENENDIKKNNKMKIVYKIFIKVMNDKKGNIFDKNIVVDKKQHYILDLDKLYIDITSTLNILNNNCKYGLNYKINEFEIEKNIRKLNLLEYDAQGLIKTENNYYKELNMEISIINTENISEKEALLNPQLHCKNDKNYKLNPTLDIINNSNLFKYNKGLEIIFENISIIFTNKELYDFTSINFDELCYDGNYDIFFDESKYKKEKSTFKKLWDKNICLIYEPLKEENKISIEFLIERYSAEFFEEKEGKIFLVTKLKNLFLTDKERKKFFIQ